MRMFSGTLAAIVCMAGSVMAADMVDNPAYQNWAKYKPGTSITYNQETGMGGMNMSMEMTQTLKEVAPDKATLEMSMKNSMMPGGAHKQVIAIPAKVEASKAQTEGKMPEGIKGEAKPLGKETVKVGDKEYECNVMSFSGEHQQSGMKMEGKTWTCPDVPGQMVKTEMKSSGEQGAMESKTQLSKVDIK